MLTIRHAPEKWVLFLATCTLTLAGCGQRGPLYIPNTPAAQQRATLPQILIPGKARADADPTPAEPMLDDDTDD